MKSTRPNCGVSSNNRSKERLASAAAKPAARKTNLSKNYSRKFSAKGLQLIPDTEAEPTEEEREVKAELERIKVEKKKLEEEMQTLGGNSGYAFGGMVWTNFIENYYKKYNLTPNF